MLRAVIALCAILAAGQADARYSNAYWNSHGLGVVQNGTQAGKVSEWLSGDAAINVYVVEPSTTKPPAAVVIFTDIFGYELPNTRLWADRLAKATGFLVVLPDFFRGDWLTEATRNTSSVWRTRHPRERVLKDFTALTAELKKNYPSVQKIGQQGFCWGGGYSVWLSSAAAPKVDAAVGFHASSVTPDAVDAVAGPLSLQQSDPKLDNGFNTTLYAYVEKAFAAKRAKGIPDYITFYANMPHGFALRGDLSDPAWRKASGAAFDQGAKFLQAQLSPQPPSPAAVKGAVLSTVKGALSYGAAGAATARSAAPKP